MGCGLPMMPQQLEHCSCLKHPGALAALAGTADACLRLLVAALSTGPCADPPLVQLPAVVTRPSMSGGV